MLVALGVVLNGPREYVSVLVFGMLQVKLPSFRPPFRLFIVKRVWYADVRMLSCPCTEIKRIQ